MGMPSEILISDFEEKLQKAMAPNHGRVDSIEKNEAKRWLIVACRNFIQGFLARNPFVTVADREKMGLPVYDKTPTSVADPTGQAEADITYPGRTQLQLLIKHVAGTPLDGKANYGCRVYHGVYAADDTLPASGKDLRESQFTRVKKLLYNFEPEDTGKTAYFAIRYENSKGKTGPWGPLFSAIIP
jgi:hypothetical protein